MRKTADIMSKTGKWLLLFGFIFSQLSFPLDVLADELIVDENTDKKVEQVTDNEGKDTDESIVQTIDSNDLESDDIPMADSDDLESDSTTDEPLITINGIKTDEYTIDGENTVEVVLEYQDEKEIKTFDFSEKLYGIYQYTFESVNKTVTISYFGNNADLLKPLANVDFSKKITYGAGNCIISGFGTGLLTVADITSDYYDLEAFEEIYGATVVVTDGDELLESTDKIVNGYQLKIKANQTDLELVNTTPETVYTISRVGDLSVDGLIDNQDQQVILDDILHDREVTGINDLNEDGKLNILDATNSLFLEKSEVEATDVLTNTLVPESKILFVGEEVKVQLLIRGFDKASLYGIEGGLSYNSDVLELNGAYLEAVGSEDLQSLGNLNLENNKFAYLLDGFNQNDGALLTLTFKAIAVGDSEVAIHNIIESYGDAFELANDSAKTVITVLDYNSKGGDVPESSNNQNTNVIVNEDTTEVTQLQNIVQSVSLSGDCYIKDLVIDGYEIDFNMYIYEYNIKVAHDVTAIKLNVLLNDSNAIYYVLGNEDFQDGENIVDIVVKAEDGSTKTYTIKVEREKETVKKATEVDEEEVKEEKSASKTIIIILIILVIIGLIYVIFKDDEEDAKEIKRESDSQLKSEKEEKVKALKEKTKEVKKPLKKGNKK